MGPASGGAVWPGRGPAAGPESGHEPAETPLVAWGDFDRIANRVRKRFAAGADQVALNLVVDASVAPLDELRRLAPPTRL